MKLTNIQQLQIALAIIAFVILNNNEIHCSLPMTASWFRDRYTAKEWDETLHHFKRSINGKIVVQRGVQLQDRSKADIEQDYLNWVWCGTAPGGVGGESCLTAVEKRVQSRGLTVERWLTYIYQEDYSKDAFLQCEGLDGFTNSSRLYYQLVLPTTNSKLSNASDPCSFVKGSSVAVVLTAFAGIDPHELLLQRAHKENVGVYMGLPQLTSGSTWDSTILPTYIAFIKRIILDHAIRFDKADYSSAFLGFYATDETFIGSPDPNLLSIYEVIANCSHQHNRKFLLSPWLDANLSQVNSSLSDHLNGFDKIISTGADYIAVQEGRGTAKGSYWWQHEANQQIAQVDDGLLKIDQYLDPTVPNNQVFKNQYTFSNRQLFEQLAIKIDAINEQRRNNNEKALELWLNVEAFEYLRSNPCLPVDPNGSGMAELLDRTTKARVDRSLTQQVAFVSNIITFAYDSDYVCVPNGFTSSLSDEIELDGWRPIVSMLTRIDINDLTDEAMQIVLAQSNNIELRNSSLIGVVGLNLENALAYTIEYRDNSGALHKLNNVKEVFHDKEWGKRNGRVAELTMVILPFANWSSLSNSSPFLSVQAFQSNWPCFLQ